MMVTAAGSAHEVSFDTADGGRVYADVYGDATTDAVVLAHGAAFERASWRELAERLAAKGHQVMAIDFRGYGKSTAGTAADARFEDILAAVRYLRRASAHRVTVIGASMGGGAAAEAATRAAPGEIDRLVLLSPVPIEHPERIGGRKLFIASAHEPSVERVKEQYDRAPEPKRLLLLPGTAHAQHIFATDQAGPLAGAIDDFVAAP
jgi:pimeloyl-ACP methyl ester carboxylesterase